MAKHEAVDDLSFKNNLLFLYPSHSLSLINWHKREKRHFDLLLLHKYCYQTWQPLVSRFLLQGLTAGVGTECTGTYPCSQNKQSVTQQSTSDKAVACACSVTERVVLDNSSQVGFPFFGGQGGGSIASLGYLWRSEVRRVKDNCPANHRVLFWAVDAFRQHPTQTDLDFTSTANPWALPNQKLCK